MSTDPKILLSALEFRASGITPLTLSSADASWILAQLKHKDDQIAALQKLVRIPPLADCPHTEETVCHEADRITSTDRQRSYGHPVYNFTRTARIWEVILDQPAGAITPEQVGLCMIGVKIARHLHSPKRDNLVDVCGFAKTVQMCADHVEPAVG